MRQLDTPQPVCDTEERVATALNPQTVIIPGGVWFESTPNGFRLRAKCLSFSDAILRVGLACVVSSLPFVLWWDLILGVWSDRGVSFWATCFFLSVWAVAIAYADILALMSLAGEFRITKESDQGAVFAGIGKLGWTYRFNWSDFLGVSMSVVRSNSGGTVRYIVLTGPDRSYRFGWLLPEERQSFIIEKLQAFGFGTSATGGESGQVGLSGLKPDMPRADKRA